MSQYNDQSEYALGRCVEWDSGSGTYDHFCVDFCSPTVAEALMHDLEEALGDKHQFKFYFDDNNNHWLPASNEGLTYGQAHKMLIQMTRK
jgi:hypothetical protein